MTNIDAVSLASVVGGAGNTKKNPTSGSGSSSTSTQNNEGAQLAGDAVTGCLSSIKNGQFNFGSCLGGAAQSVLKGLGFGGSTTSTK
jgi:hypothetical protein